MSLKRKRAAPADDSPTTYAAASIAGEAKTVFAALYLAGPPREWTRVAFREKMADAGYVVSKAQFDRWVARAGAGEAAITPAKEAGPVDLLTDLQMAILAGAVLDANEKKEPVARKHYKKWALDFFGIDMTKATAGNYLRRSGFKKKAMTRRTSGFKRRRRSCSCKRGVTFQTSKRPVCAAMTLPSCAPLILRSRRTARTAPAHILFPTPNSEAAFRRTQTASSRAFGQMESTGPLPCAGR